MFDDVQFAHVVYVELDDGSKVKALWDKNLGEVVGGMKLEIEPIDGLVTINNINYKDVWKVIRIVKTPPAPASMTPGQVEGVFVDKATG